MSGDAGVFDRIRSEHREAVARCREQVLAAEQRARDVGGDAPMIDRRVGTVQERRPTGPDSLPGPPMEGYRPSPEAPTPEADDVEELRPRRSWLRSSW